MPRSQALADGVEDLDGMGHVVDRLDHYGKVVRALVPHGGSIPNFKADAVVDAGSGARRRAMSIEPSSGSNAGLRVGLGDGYGRPPHATGHIGYSRW